jgi:hypothetical protein
LAILQAALMVLQSRANACSVDDTYRVPTNLELVEQADVILLGVVESGPDEIDSMNGVDLVVRPTELIKGESLPAELRTVGMIASGNFAVTSDPNELESAHPLAYIGGCARYMFVRGSTVLFFLKREGDRLVPLVVPFARWAEDVPSVQAPWVRAVRIYAEVASLPQSERRAALAARRDALRAASNDRDAAIIADDIDRQMRGPNRPWNAIIEEQIRRISH